MTMRFAPPLLFAVRLLAASLACVGPATASAPPSASAEAFEEALNLYSQGNWSAAYRHFARLADQGDQEAARIALQMLHYGARLYGHAWGASQAQSDQWTALTLQRIKALRVNAEK
jgi:2,4-dienoyl-CoA reductase-like NADH-dependent reductase (Old Yellow Enzyme family)